jgi:hypothetical protein
MTNLTTDNIVMWLATMSDDPIDYIERVINMSMDAVQLEMPDDLVAQERVGLLIARLRGYIADIRVRGIDAVYRDMLL